ncbi:inositol 2-dehydrogenase [Facilibium subflavum]|uniref:inositol 2-dehydrogenase n=1 Tax=Facilibium subflavum TaxID=2219058 RepID=UPI000E6547A5|nr:inositol 2-dehydrogenase [Facilibium subflavum]
MSTRQIGLIGTGRIGQVHVHNIHRYLNDHVVTHAYDPFVNDAWLAANNIVKADSVESLLKQDIDCVLICSPSGEHSKQIIAAAAHKKHIFCEKPVGLETDEIEQSLVAVEQAGVVLQVGFNRRFDPSFAKVKSDIKDKVGIPQIVRITSYDPACPPEEYVKGSGGMFFDMTIHDFDMARFLADSEVVEVFATGSCLINPDFKKYNDVDTAMVQLKFANGALGVIANSRQAVYGYDQRVEVFSNNACLKADNQTQSNIRSFTKDGISTPVLKNFFLERYKEAYINQFHAFFSAIENNKPVVVNGFDGLQAVNIAKAAKKSFESKSPVTVTG